MVTRAPRTPGHKRPPIKGGALSGSLHDRAEQASGEAPYRLATRKIYGDAAQQGKPLPTAPQPKPQGSPGS